MAEFVAESLETLDVLEPLVARLDGGEQNPETLHTVFRLVHSIKGTASFCELPILTEVAHSAESLLDGLRRGTLRRTSLRVDVLCAFVDFLRLGLDALQRGNGEEAYAAEAELLSEKIEAAILQLSTKRPAELDELSSPTLTTPPAVPAPSLDAVAPFDLGFLPELLEKFVAESDEHIATVEQALLQIERSSATPETIEEAFRCMHSFKGNCGILGLAELEEITHILETTLLGWTKGAAPEAEQVTTILGVLDVARGALEALPDGRGIVPGRVEILEKLAALSMGRPEKKRLKRRRESSSSAPPASRTGPAPAPPEVAVRSDSPPSHRLEGSTPSEKAPLVGPEGKAPRRAEGEKNATSIRVDTKKLDELMNLVGELIIAETTVTHNPDLDGYEFENFQKASLHLNRITRMLQDVTMQARMVPIETTFRKMVRLVRDVANKQGKEVSLLSSGEETEVDKSVIETIGDPLVHLVRNAVDHGLEPPEVRLAAGKPRAGTVRLEAKHQGGEVWISLSDDGRGIDPDKIFASAVKKGLVEAGRTLSRQETLNLIFAPGFSTAEKLTDISGRGVGMDVVKKNIERVNGRIDIDTVVGSGTTFTLRIPLTLAIIEGMLVRVGDAFYTIPLLAIRESVRAGREQLTQTSSGQELLRLRAAHHPIVKLGRFFGGAKHGGDVERGILVLVESGDSVAAVLVDEVVGQRQTVIKPLPEYLRGVPALSGCSILHNGEISLIVDVDALVRGANERVAA